MVYGAVGGHMVTVPIPAAVVRGHDDEVVITQRHLTVVILVLVTSMTSEIAILLHVHQIQQEPIIRYYLYINGYRF